MFVFMSRDDVTWCFGDGGGNKSTIIYHVWTLMRMVPEHKVITNDVFKNALRYTGQKHRDPIWRVQQMQWQDL